MSGTSCFTAVFKDVTGFSPFRWQTRLFELFAKDRIPSSCDIPTGLGKTSVIVIWLLALAWQAREGRVSLPRRLVYVVNRRTVVDQATDDALALRRSVLAADPSGTLGTIRTGLASLCVDPNDEASPLAVSTLRGELADNREWQADPSRPAVIVGTVDMIGSRLLFSGYGPGWKTRALHAGLIGHDSLIVHDEAHLSPAFGDLIRYVVRTQSDGAELRPLRVLELSATPRSSKPDDLLEMTDAEMSEPLIRRRVQAPKRLRLHRVEEPGALVERIADAALAFRDERARVLVYVRSPEDAKAVHASLREEVGAQRTTLLTGTLRGYERDRLAETNVFTSLKAGASRPEVEESLFLVSTSAGEVGANFDADHLVCDLTTLDSMIQRLGRVNRLGRDDDGFVAKVEVFDAPETKALRVRAATPYEQARVNSREALRRLPSRDGAFDASPGALRRIVDGDTARAAFAPSPRSVPCTDILLDAWALTSVRDSLPGRPPVDRWLHGVESEPPETTFVWRAEASELASLVADGREDEVEEWLETHRIEIRERLRESTGRAKEEMRRMASRLPEGGKTLLALIVRPDSETSTRPIADLSDEGLLAGALVLLPPEAGGLSPSGMLDGRAGSDSCDDVADASEGTARTRVRVRISWSGDEKNWQIAPLGLRHDAMAEQLPRVASGDGSLEDAISVVHATLRGGAEPRLVERIRLVTDHDDEGRGAAALLSFSAARHVEMGLDASAAAPLDQTLDDHLVWTARVARRLATTLDLSADFAASIEAAARLHDRGKNRPLWQRAIFHPPGAPDWVPWAKTSHGRFDLRACAGYRHEFGSLVEAMRESAAGAHLGDDSADLILHLIACHHGRARPHFSEGAWDPDAAYDENANAAVETIRRYARLQRRFGRWGLAWLEAIMRSADAIASRRGETVKELPE